jgi:hypothetical protein
MRAFTIGVQMTYTHKLSRRLAISLCMAAGLLAACDGSDSTGPSPLTSDAPSPTLGAPATGELTALRQYTAFGAFGIHAEDLNENFTSTIVMPSPKSIRRHLDNARARRAQVFIRLTGGPSKFTEDNGEFNLGQWKARIARFKGIDLSSYVADGTLLGHYMIDEPHDRSNWNGKAIPYSTLEEMGRYSKQLFPTVPTVVRSTPSWLAKASFGWKYVDAGWAQYSARKGEVKAYAAGEVAAAKRAGLGLVVGLNVLHGGNPSGSRRVMSASQVSTFGKALLANDYVCAFVAWKKEDAYYSRSDIRAAMGAVRQVAKARPASGCVKH